MSSLIAMAWSDVALRDWLSVALVVFLLYLVQRLSGVRGNKPFAWEEAIEKGTVSPLLKKLESNYSDKVRFYNFWFQINRLKEERVPGAFAEVGVYRGESAKVIHAMDPTRRFYLFDTFQGFSDKDLKEERDGTHASVDFSTTSVDRVRSYIQGNENILFREGYFPESAATMEGPFAFLHLDADLYVPTLAALRFFYPLLSEGGVIIVHDFNHTWSGVRKAVTEFLATIPEPGIEIADVQGSVMIVKLKTRPPFI